MLHVFIINVNAGKNNSILLNNVINGYCSNLGINYKIEFVHEKEDTERITNIYKNWNDVTFYSVGGDGTLIGSAQMTFGSGIPLLGVNRGHLGYLCDLNDDTVFEGTEKLTISLPQKRSSVIFEYKEKE